MDGVTQPFTDQPMEAMTDEQLKEMHEQKIVEAINDSILGLAKAVKDTQHIDVPVAILNPAAPLKPSNVLATLMMFYNTACLLPQSKVINDISPQFKTILSENYAEKQQHILTIYAQYGLLKEFLANCNYPNFSFADVFMPSFNRYKAQLHSISNFLWFREEATESLYSVLTEYKAAHTQSKPILESTSALKLGISRITDEIVKLRETTSQLPSRVDPLVQRYNKALESQQRLNKENNEFTNQVLVLTDELADLENQAKKKANEYEVERSTLITKEQNNAVLQDIQAAEALSHDLRAQYDALVSSINIFEQHNAGLLGITNKITELIDTADQYSNSSDQLQAQLENLQGMKEVVNNLNAQIDASKQEIENMNNTMQSGSAAEQTQDNPSFHADEEECRRLTEECEGLEATYAKKLTQLKALQQEINDENAKIVKVKADAAEKMDKLSDKANEMMSAFVAQLTGMISKLNSM
ncbi:Chromosome segregation protein SMC [Giardia duodenalis]|uniref:Golgi/cell cycle associated protein, putative n=2 Tax=Giardia intestinalis TaxID=5741 RepID=C6LYA0_GIAIB|nr:Golgi/cell cycle associated protein, putative [Giardia intestinalis ATCC 50581]ESU43686.1 Chromosome segregation protein SMC [Giardia intestinalis]